MKFTPHSYDNHLMIKIISEVKQSRPFVILVRSMHLGK